MRGRGGLYSAAGSPTSEGFESPWFLPFFSAILARLMGKNVLEEGNDAIGGSGKAQEPRRLGWFGRWHSISMRMSRWAKNGILDQMFEHWKSQMEDPPEKLSMNSQQSPV